MEKSLRLRANISISVKGQKTWDCTADGEGYTREELLVELDALVAELTKRCPILVEEAKK